MKKLKISQSSSTLKAEGCPKVSQGQCGIMYRGV